VVAGGEASLETIEDGLKAELETALRCRGVLGACGVEPLTQPRERGLVNRDPDPIPYDQARVDVAGRLFSRTLDAS
jgi:hypothetical protein